MKISDKTLNNFLNFCSYHFVFPSSSSLPIISINSQLSRSFRGVVTHAKLVSLADTALLTKFNDTMLNSRSMR